MAYINGNEVLFSANISGALVNEQIEADISALRVDVDSNTRRVLNNERRIDALWKLNEGIAYQFETDATTAYSKAVPSGAKLASINMLGGMSYKCENLWWHNKTYSSTEFMLTYNNGAYYFDGDMGDVSKTIEVGKVVLPAGTYTFSMECSSAYTLSPYHQWAKMRVIKTDYSESVMVANKTTTEFITKELTGGTYYLQFIPEGTYQNLVVKPAILRGVDMLPFDGVRHAKVKAIKVVNKYNQTVWYKDIPESIQNNINYGVGLNEECYNYINFATKGYKIYANAVDMGTLSFIKAGNVASDGSFVWSFVPPNSATNIDGDNYEVIADGFYCVTEAYVEDLVKGEILARSDGVMWLAPNTDSIDALMSLVSGKELVYKRHTSAISYVKDDLSVFATIPVEYGDTIIFYNEYGLPVPSEVEYAVKLAEV